MDKIEIVIFDDDIRAYTRDNINKYFSFMDVRKKPIIIQAIQILVSFKVNALEGEMFGKPGDYLMRGIDGEHYICDKDIFERTYDILGEHNG